MTTESTEVGDVVTTRCDADVSVERHTRDRRTGGPAMGERILDVRNFSVDYGWGESAVRAVDSVDLAPRSFEGARDRRRERLGQVDPRLRHHPTAARARRDHGRRGAVQSRRRRGRRRARHRPRQRERERAAQRSMVATSRSSSRARSTRSTPCCASASSSSRS